jgi:hypothetical protein
LRLPAFFPAAFGYLFLQIVDLAAKRFCRAGFCTFLLCRTDPGEAIPKFETKKQLHSINYVSLASSHFDRMGSGVFSEVWPLAAVLRLKMFFWALSTSFRKIEKANGTRMTSQTVPHQHSTFLGCFRTASF